MAARQWLLSISRNSMANPSSPQLGLTVLDDRRCSCLLLANTGRAKCGDLILEAGPLSSEDQSLGLSASSACHTHCFTVLSSQEVVTLEV